MLLLLLLSFAVKISYSSAPVKDSIIHLNKIQKFAVIIPSDSVGLPKEVLNDMRSLENSFRTVGIDYKSIKAKGLKSNLLADFDIVVLPYASSLQLKQAEVSVLRDAIGRGTNIVFDGASPLCEALGVKLAGDKLVITKAVNLTSPRIPLFWSNTSDTWVVDTLQSRCSSLCIAEETKQPLAVWGQVGAGKFIYFSSLFDGVTDKGYSRYPFLIEYMNQVFGPVTVAERYAAEMFFDPGMRDSTFSASDLAKLWRARGIKRIYAAGWYFDYGYDYEELVETCHANGILVYCWLEPPMISLNFWKQHPEWREKTAYLKDAQIDWRSLVNLADERCRKAVFDSVGRMLLNAAWDGVNLAELYFEPSPMGPENPANFTPMNDIVRDEFKQIGGFDPVLLFDQNSSHYWKRDVAGWRKFASYRKDLCYRLKTQFLDFLKTIEAQKKDFELMLTVIDVSMTPELSDNIAEDTRYSLDLYKKYGVTMQIEDPSSCWGLTPERYDHLGQLYRKRINDKDRLIFDCNVVGSHEEGYGGFPAEKPTGEEIRQITFNMALSNSRPAFYAEDALNDNDFKNISSVLARQTKVKALSTTEWEIDAPFMVRICTGDTNKAVMLDIRLWNAGEQGNVIVPAGKHRLTMGESTPSACHLKTISGELLSATFGKNQLNFVYKESVNACFVILDRKPLNIEIDGKQVEPEIIVADGEVSVKLPRGKHAVKMSF
jgi:hypothetical protein